MKNLILNVVRSFKKNKISIIGLVLLLFFGLGAFCTMSNTTNNITKQYNSISKQGNLHDFTVSELYNVGSAGYQPNTKGISYYVPSREGTPEQFTKYTSEQFIAAGEHTHKPTTAMYSGSGYGTEAGWYYITLPEQKQIGEGDITTFIRTYHITLDESHSTGLYQNFAKNKKGTTYTTFDYRITETFDKGSEPQALLDYQNLIDSFASWDENSTKEAARLNIYSRDYQDFTKFVNDKTQTIYSIMTTTDTPLSEYLNENYSNELEHRSFKSLNVTATKDNVFYKIIDSNIEDTIDKVVLFKDPNNRTGNNLFSINDWSPYDSDIVFYGTDGKIIEPGTKLENITIPSTFIDVATTILQPVDVVKEWSTQEKLVYTQLLQIRFKRMLAANRSFNKLDDILKTLSARGVDYKKYNTDFFNESSEIATNYNTYYNRWNQLCGESVTVSANGNVVYQWTEPLGTPQTCTISNWTSKMSIVNPQHLQAVGKAVLDPKILYDFAPFKAWHDANYASNDLNPSNIDQAIAKKWFNSLTSDQFTFWVKPDSLKVDEMVYDNIDSAGTTITVKKGTKAGQWNGISSSYIIPCGGYDEIIWGCGLSPDFMYPVVDISRPTPNIKTEALVYCNDTGYNSIKLAFVNSTVEEYQVAKFKSTVYSDRQKEIVKDINNWAKTNMIYPKNIDCAYFATDTNNVLNASSFRVAYIPNLVNVINIVSIVLCSFIGILCLVICFVIIKRYVENNRVNIGIMRANGISKIKIAASLFPFALLPAIVGGIAAYVVGLWLQVPALSLFKNYWTLPTPLIGFDWLSFVGCIILPFLIFTLICFLSTFVVLRARTVDLMKPGSEFKTNGFSRVVKKPFKYFGILTRFRVSLAFNSIYRLLMLAAMSCLTMTSLVFAMTTFDKLNQSKAVNSSQFDYEFSLKLTTPTVSGSVFSTYDYGNIGRYGHFNPDQYIYNVSWDTSDEAGKDYSWYNPAMYSQLAKPYSVDTISGLELLNPGWYRNTIGANGNIMFPNMSDSKGQNQDLLFLQNKQCSRISLDYNIGLAPLAASNPWEIALALMPANSRNLAADAFNSIVQESGKRITNASKTFNEVYEEEKHYHSKDYAAKVAKARAGDWCRLGYSADEYYNRYEDFFIAKTEGETTTYTLKTDMLTVGYLFMAFNEDFLSLLKTIFTDPDMLKLEYQISYGNVPLNWDINAPKKDELYTYISANILNTTSNKNVDKSEEITIEGIPQNSNFIKLTDSKKNDLNRLLFEFDAQHRNTELPIVINAYAAHKYKLKVGDTIDIKATNMADRYIRTIHPENYKDDKSDLATFKIVGISEGTNNSAFYTTQYDANTLLGLPNGQTWNKTHKYMMWTDEGSEWSEQAAGASLVDLAGVGADDNHITKYSFTNSTKPVVDTTSITKRNHKIPTGFNGIYTASKSGKPITSGLSLYSYTGMYPGTSVHKSITNDKFVQILTYGPNLSIANLMTGINEPQYYKANQDYFTKAISKEQYIAIIESFRNRVADIYGETTMMTAMIGAMDVAASDQVYANLISTFNLAQTSIMAIIIPITIIIVAIISNLIIMDSKKMAAMLKALGYSDRKNLMSILALFIPTIIIGLALAIPLTLGVVVGYQAIIFNTANILVDVTQHWWYYLVGVGGIGVILLGTYAIGYASIKKDRLVDQIK